MQRMEFLQQLWLDYIHQHPDIGDMRLWPVEQLAEYLVLLTLDKRPMDTASLLPGLYRFGYHRMGSYAVADRGLLITLLSPRDHGPWLVLAELQLGALTREPRQALESLVEQAHPQDARGQNLLCRGRPWPMPDWPTYQILQEAHPLAAWLAAMGPRLHHAGFDCDSLGSNLVMLDRAMQESGLTGSADRQQGLFPVSPLLSYRYYPCCSQKLTFAQGDEHRIVSGGIALVQKCLPGKQERSAEFLLPHHTRCEFA
ncbi:VOC family protein [Halomonas sp. WWR20]